MKQNRGENSELQNRHGMRTTISFGLDSFEIQDAVALYYVNLKRIMKLDFLIKTERMPKNEVFFSTIHFDTPSQRYEGNISEPAELKCTILMRALRICRRQKAVYI